MGNDNDHFYNPQGLPVSSWNILLRIQIIIDFKFISFAMDPTSLSLSFNESAMSLQGNPVTLTIDAPHANQMPFSLDGVTCTMMIG